MKSAADFRQIARNALSGRIGIPLLAGLIASALGVTVSTTPQVNFNFNLNNTASSGQPLVIPENDTTMQVAIILLLVFLTFFSIVMAIAIAQALVAGIVEVGYFRFNLDLVDRQKSPSIGTLFRYFRHWKNIIVAQLLQLLYILPWLLLFIVPGIVVSYKYAMTSYILAEHPELTAKEAIERSTQMMYGNRFRLFCLQLSFIGWDLLCIFTCGIGNLWLTPYKQAATAAFYREVSGTGLLISDETAPTI